MKIKFLLAALAVFAFVSVPAQAQDELETRHEIAVSYGAVSNSNWIDAYSEVISAIFGAKHDKHSFVGPVGLEYYYHINPLVGVGAIATYSGFKEDELGKDDNVSATLKNSYISLMPSVKFNWLRRNNWGLYSKLAAGATYSHSSKDDVNDKTNTTDDKVFFNFQASAIGVEVGGEHALGFLELGVGEQGIALAGVRFKF